MLALQQFLRYCPCLHSKKHPHQNGWGCRRITESGEEQLLESVWPFNLCQPILIQFNMLDGVAAECIDDVNYPIGRLEN
jgi:hypothetical protein